MFSMMLLLSDKTGQVSPVLETSGTLEMRQKCGLHVCVFCLQPCVCVVMERGRERKHLQRHGRGGRETGGGVGGGGIGAGDI